MPRSGGSGRVLHRLLDDVLGGHRLTEEEAASLLQVRDRGVFAIAAAADALREEKVGDTVTYVRNQNIHVTNICKNLCGFCGFGRPKGSDEGYLLGSEQIAEQARLARERGVTEIYLLSGVHPHFTAETYADLIARLHAAIPGADIHTASPDEIAWAARQSGISSGEVIRRLRAAGLGTLQGTAAEILVDHVRAVICPNKVRTGDWIRIIREAHGMGIRSTATILYGHVETAADRARHLAILREIQDETRGFTEFVPLSWLHARTPLYASGTAPPGATGREDILLFAVSRLFLDNFDNIQIPWQKVGRKMASPGLQCGGNGLGGTMYADAVSAEAGGEGGGYFDPAEMQRIAEDLGRTLRQRTTTYGRVG